MDPLLILKVLWRHKWVALPMLLITAIACGYVLFLAPRTYEASATYALAEPKLPTAQELEDNPALAKKNQDNPYLRSTDSSLLSQVVIARMSSSEVVRGLQNRGLGTTYKVEPLNSLTSGLVSITASANDPTVAVATAKWLSEQFMTTMHDVQKVNGADDLFLVTPISVEPPGPAVEVFSSRLRTVIMTGVGGLVLVFAAVSIAQSVSINRGSSNAKRRRPSRRGQSNGVPDSGPEEDADSAPVVMQLRGQERPGTGKPARGDREGKAR